MKTKLFSLALGTVALSACTSEEIIDVNTNHDNAIGFENVIKKSSRADNNPVEGDLDNTKFDQFMVYGYYTKENEISPVQIFTGVPVHKTGSPEAGYKWVYEGTRYWVPDCKYYFYAYSCGDIALSSSFGQAYFVPASNKGPLTISNYICDASHQHDLVTAKKENIVAKVDGNPEVTLTFSHALCKAKAVFTTDFPAGYKIYLSDVSISSFYNKANFIFQQSHNGDDNKDEWSDFEHKGETPSITLNIPVNSFVETKQGSQVETSEVFLIPKLYVDNDEAVQLHFKIKVTKGTETILERGITGTWYPKWAKGNIYVYNINLTGTTTGIQPIVFAASQELNGTKDSPWDVIDKLEMKFGID